MLNRERERWLELKAACDDPSSPAWHWNGKLGVILDPSWYDFNNFIADIGVMPGMNSYIDREPGTDCFSKKTTKWRNGKEKILTLHGITLTVSEWSQKLGIPKGTIDTRIRKNLPVTQVLRRGKLYRQDLTDKKFGMLTVMSFDNSKNSEDFWKCKCDCGSRLSIAAKVLQTHKVMSCGCVSSKSIAFIKNKSAIPRLSGTRELSRLSGLKESTIRHRRNIGVHPSNLTQIQNIEKGKLYEYDGLCMTLDQWAVYLNESVATLRNRLYSGWSFEDAIKIPARKRKS
jgi:hypothetical protein